MPFVLPTESFARRLDNGLGQSTVGPVSHDQIDAASYQPGGHLPPLAWPPALRWILAGQRNAADLFPLEAYRAVRVDRRIGPHYMVIINDPHMAREICSTPSGYRLSNIQRRLLGPILGDGLTLAEGETWREQRRGAGRLSGEALRSCASNSSLDAMVRQELSAWSESDGALDVLSALKSAALNLIARTMFSTSSSIASPEVMTAVREVEACLAAFDWADGVGAPAWFRTRKMRRAEMAARQFDSEIMDTLRACQRAAQGRDNPSALETVSNRDFVISMLSGFESVALSVFWGMIELARDDGAIARHGLDAFIDEVLRLYPPLPFILRVAQDEDRRFGKIVPRNALICISPWLLQRHELYWDNPSAFMPGRFQATGTRPDAFIPFGLGARRCIGMHLARRLIAALLSEIHAKWRLEVADGSSPRPIAGVSLRPSKPVSFTLTLRRLA